VPPVFCTVTFCVAVDFTVSFPKFTTLGVSTKLDADAWPLPLSEIDAGCIDALVRIFAVALLFPELVGENVKLMFALDIGRIVLGTASPATENCAFETVTDAICKGTLPVFVIVTVCVACCPTVTAGKFTVLADSDTPGIAFCVYPAHPMLSHATNMRLAAHERLRNPL
jgi:hypothetical protein